MTPRENALATALGKCRLPPASFAKRFGLDIAAQARADNGVGRITDRQSARLDIQCYIFRRQMPPELVPAVPPPGYSTPKMRAAQQKALQAEERVTKRIDESDAEERAEIGCRKSEEAVSPLPTETLEVRSVAPPASSPGAISSDSVHIAQDDRLADADGAAEPDDLFGHVPYERA